MSLPVGYRMVDGPPSLDDYVALRLRTGLSPKRSDQAAAAIDGAWAAVHVACAGGTVGMGRVLGDGGWYFHVLDMAVLPEHQRRGLGEAILTALLDRIRRDAPQETPYACLFADPPGRKLYERHGFRPTAPGSVGMAGLP